MSEEPDAPRELFEIQLVLADVRKFVRVREATPEQAQATVCTHFPAWSPVSIRRWAGERWVVATPPT